MKAYLWEPLDENKVKCNLCNHRCLIKEGRRGICAVRENRGGILETLVYGTLVARHIDPIEKKPLFHFLPDPLSYSIEVSGENNNYKWYKDGALLPDQTSNTLYIESASYDDQGAYVLKVNNSSVPLLELESYEMVMSIITGLDDIASEDYVLYPNPVTDDNLYIKTSYPLSANDVRIMSVTGDQLLREILESKINHIDVSRLGKGIYFARITNKDGSQTISKFIIK